MAIFWLNATEGAPHFMFCLIFWLFKLSARLFDTFAQHCAYRLWLDARKGQSHRNQINTGSEYFHFDSALCRSCLWTSKHPRLLSLLLIWLPSCAVAEATPSRSLSWRWWCLHFFAPHIFLNLFGPDVHRKCEGILRRCPPSCRAVVPLQLHPVPSPTAWYATVLWHLQQSNPVEREQPSRLHRRYWFSILFPNYFVLSVYLCFVFFFNLRILRVVGGERFVSSFRQRLNEGMTDQESRRFIEVG